MAELDLGVSSRALSIARMIDRLDEGEWVMYLSKGEVTGMPWKVSFGQVGEMTKRTVGELKTPIIEPVLPPK